jgi:hypothetical protein
VHGNNAVRLLLLQVLCLRLQSASGFEDEMVVAFRGTETDGSGAASDILTDMYALQVRGSQRRPFTAHSSSLM